MASLGSPTRGGAASPRACGAFRSNLYRPALCIGCYCDIAAHFPGLWKLKTDFATGRRVYINTQTGAVLNPRPGDVAAAGDDGGGEDATATRRRTNPLADALPAGLVDARAAGWSEFAARFDGSDQPPPGKVDARGAHGPPAAPAVRHAGQPVRVTVDTQLHESPLAAAGLLVSPSEHVPDLPSGVPVSALANMAIDLLALTAAIGGGGAAGGSAAVQRDDAAGAPALLLSSAGGFTPTPPKLRPAPPGPPTRPAAPLVPVTAAAASDATAPPLEAVAPALQEPAPRSPPPPVPRPPPPRGSPLSSGDPPHPAPPTPPPQPPRSSAGDEAASVVGRAMPPPPTPPACQQPPSPLLSAAGGGGAAASVAAAPGAPAAAGAPTAGVGDLASFLAPLYADPLLVDLHALGAPGSGVRVIPIKQPFEESFSLPRYLLVTPFTIMAVGAHPSVPRLGILKWERSLLSLRHLATQPLLRRLPAPAPAPADGGSSSGGGGGVLGFFTRRRAGSSSAAAPEPPAAGSPLLPSTTARGGPLHASSQLAVYGVGVLASFAAESHDTMTFLRTYRAGRRAVLKEGWLSKRKKSSWREHAPLGPLAWKRRWFVLSPHALTYYSAPPAGAGSASPPAPAGGDAERLFKGVVPLTGWVEVARQHEQQPEGGGGGGGKHAFVVRTGSTYHAFTVGSAAEADEWVAAISVNAQHVGATQNEPQCLELPSAAVASDVAAAIVQRRRFLVESMSLRSRMELGDAADLHLDIMHELAPAGGVAAGRKGGRAGGGRGGVYGYDGGDYDSDERVDPDAVIDGMSVREAHSIVLTAAAAGGGGGGDNEVLAQLHPALAAAVRQYQAQLDSGRHDGASGSGAWAAPGGRQQQGPGALPPLAPGEGAWCYLDDSDALQGPFSDARMRSWLLARYFGPATLVRFALPVPELDASCAVDEAGVPQSFLPISTLFSDPGAAFTPAGGGVWLPAYREAIVYQTLVETAVGLGLQRERVAGEVLQMRALNLPPELDLLLDMVGWAGTGGPAPAAAAGDAAAAASKAAVLAM